MNSSWPQTFFHNLQRVQDDLRALEARLRRASAADLLVLAGYLGQKPPDGTRPTRELQPPNQRQTWCLDQMREGKPFIRQMIERKFKVTDKTAKRDLQHLLRLRLIRFVRTPRPGHYELVVRDAKGCISVGWGAGPENASPCDFHI